MTKILCNNIVLLASLVKAELQEKFNVTWTDVELHTTDNYKKCGKKAIAFKGIVELQDERIYFYVTFVNGQPILRVERTKQIENEISYNSPDVKNLNDGEKIIITKYEDTVNCRKIYPEESYKIPFDVSSQKDTNETISRHIVKILLKECD